MGITVSPASSSGGGGGSSGTLPVVPGTAVTREIYTDTGFTTGDYVYRYGTGSVGSAPNSSTFSVGSASYVRNGVLNTSTLWNQSVSKSNFVAPQIPPSSLTYSGASTTFCQNTLAETVLQATSILRSPRVAVLSNGNIASIFVRTSPTSDLLFQITTPNGTAVANGTVTGVHRDTQNYGTSYDICSINSGGFAVAFETSSGVNTIIYDNAGNVTRSAVYCGVAGSNGYYPKIICGPTNSLYLSFAGTNGGSGTAYLILLNSSGTSTTTVQPQSGYYPLGAVSIAVNTLGNVFYVFIDGVNSLAHVMGAYNSTLTTNLLSDNNSNYYYYPPIVVVTPSNGFLVFGVNASNNVVGRYWTPTASASGSWAVKGGVTFNNFDAISYSGPVTGAFNNATNASAILMTQASNAYSVLVATVDTTTSTVTFSSSATSLSTTYSGTTFPQLVPLTGSTFIVPYRNATPNPVMKQFNSIALTSGSSTTSFPTASAPTPTNGYYLLGVATTTAAAGTDGTIAINGQASPSASYGTSATPIGFDYNPRNVGGLPNGNKGYVVNRVVTLTGLE